MQNISSINFYRVPKGRGRKLNVRGRTLPRSIQIPKPSFTRRVVDSVPYPEARKLTIDEVFKSDNKVRIEELIEHFRKEGRVEDAVAKKIVGNCTQLLREEATLLELEAPINICGDLHGQFFDMVQLLEIGGKPPDVRYLFLGDYVDRGTYGIEVILCLFAMKINYPDCVYLLRGNHECRHLTETFTFKREVMLKYSENLYRDTMAAFDCLPLSALINNQFLCMHGGISPEIDTLSDIRNIFRFREPPAYGAMCDLLWSDPIGNYDTSLANEFFTHNFTRGCSYFFSYAACCDFLKRNKLLSIVRAHEVQMAGFRMYKKNSATGYPSLITIFSAPNYLDLFRNKAAILKYRDNNINIQQFAHSPHPYWLPNFTDVFTWSLPFVIERVAEIFSTILNICSDNEVLNEPEHKDEAIKLRHDVIRKKIRALGKIAIAFADERRISETMVHLRGVTPTKEILQNASPQKAKQFKSALVAFERGENNFNLVRNLDSINEEYPQKV